MKQQRLIIDMRSFPFKNKNEILRKIKRNYLMSDEGTLNVYTLNLSTVQCNYVCSHLFLCGNLMQRLFLFFYYYFFVPPKLSNIYIFCFGFVIAPSLLLAIAKRKQY